MQRGGITVARCTVECQMRHLGLRGVRRGKVVRTSQWAMPMSNVPWT